MAYLVDMAHAFLAPVLIAGLVHGLAAPSRRLTVFGAWAILAGLIVGGLAHGLSVSLHAETVVRTALRLAAVAAAVAALAAIAVRLRSRTVVAAGAVIVLLVFFAQAMADVLTRAATHGLTATSVLNTELIVNIAAIALGATILAAAIAVTAHAGRVVGARAAWLLAVLLAVTALVATAEAMLGLLQLGAIEVTGGRVSFVAKVTGYSGLATYAELGLMAFLLLLTKNKSWGTQRVPQTPCTPPQARTLKAKYQAERRWLKRLTAIIAFLVTVLLYHDLYASRPPTLSAAVTVVPDGEGRVRIPIDTVKDGSLHRFAYVSGDGHRVRFFLINRYDAEHVRIGVVFDACMICGDEGYIQEGDEVICIACNVRLFRPSIGKPGGCNPIPLRHEADATHITVAAADLEKGARYFSEVVEIEVTDPVTSARVINVKAPYRYDHDGRTFFFAAKSSYDAFREDPAKYVSRQSPPP